MRRGYERSKADDLKKLLSRRVRAKEVRDCTLREVGAHVPHPNFNEQYGENERRSWYFNIYGPFRYMQLYDLLTIEPGTGNRTIFFQAHPSPKTVAGSRGAAPRRRLSARCIKAEESHLQSLPKP